MNKPNLGSAIANRGSIRGRHWVSLSLIKVSLLSVCNCTKFACYKTAHSIGTLFFSSRWLSILPHLVAMTASLWKLHQTSWCVRYVRLWPTVHTKWHAVGGSTAKPAWMNTRNAPTLVQTAGRWDKASLTSEVSEFQTSVTWGVYPAMSLPP